MSETNNSNEVVVSIKNLQKAFGDNVVLRDIDLDVHKGEVVVVLGPSGSGKSTMLRCINRLEHPTSGSIIVEGVDVCAKGVDLNKVRTHLGMVFQQFNLFPHLSVKKNVMLAQQGRGREDRRRGADQGRSCRAYRLYAESAFGRPAAARCHRPRPVDEPARHAL